MIKDIKTLLSGNSYPGRGIITGLTPDGKNAVSAYFIMGRSDNSRNRVFARRENGDIFTQAYDESKVSDPSLIIYNAVRKSGNSLIVTNGDQTDTVYDALVSGGSFESALETREFEPDSPNFTPRISAILDFNGGYTYKMSILKSADDKGSSCNRFTFAYSPVRGLGHFIHTYVGDGNPLPSFEGEPERVLLTDDIEDFAQSVWEALDENNRISLCVRYTEIESGSCTEKIINKNV